MVLDGTCYQLSDEAYVYNCDVPQEMPVLVGGVCNKIPSDYNMVKAGGVTYIHLFSSRGLDNCAGPVVVQPPIINSTGKC